jgi:deoxyribonuclease-4
MQHDFITLIDETIGLDMVELLHLNDAIHACGSRIDKHALLGHGTIGITALQSFALHPRLATIPLILDLPSLPIEQDNAMLSLARSWHTK